MKSYWGPWEAQVVKQPIPGSGPCGDVMGRRMEPRVGPVPRSARGLPEVLSLCTSPRSHKRVLSLLSLHNK